MNRLQGATCSGECRQRTPGGQRSVVRRWFALTALPFLLLALSACGSLAPRGVVPMSTAVPGELGTDLGRIAAASTPEPGLSGFRLLPLGAFSLDARVQLAQRAQRTLDVQYYVLENDSTGRLLLRQLRDAAERGVRVRLLLDDLYTTHSQALLSDLAAYPNVQVRVFNPFCCARESGVAGRLLASLGDVRRVNHRMHNKLLIADGVMAVAGGRNIADEYFMRNEQQNFVDMDALALGDVVSQLASIFDTYWNSEVVYPLDVLWPALGTPAERRERAGAALVDAKAHTPLPANDVLGYGPVSEDFEGGRIGLIWGPARAYADPPDKRSKNNADALRGSVAFDAMMTLWTAKSELTITSPYMIPGRQGLQAFENLRKENVRVTVLTNSLAATDEPLVHTGYARYRGPLLAAGVELYELSPLRTQRNKRLGVFGSSTGSLHAKTAVVDGRTVFIGSMNLDPRSATQNTELGIFIESPQLAKELQRVINVSRLQSAYRVRLSPSGALQWLALEDGAETVHNEEPESSLWQRVYNWLISPFVPEQLL
jgi:cardiolipin synthase C